ncbi:MAG: hypothetical protein ACRCU5_12025 [Rhizobiaceae bacterium]
MKRITHFKGYDSCVEFDQSTQSFVTIPLAAPELENDNALRPHERAQIVQENNTPDAPKKVRRRAVKLNNVRLLSLGDSNFVPKAKRRPERLETTVI